MDDRLVRAAELSRIVALSRTQVWRLEKAGKFPRRRRLGPNSVAWLLSEVQEFLRTREVVVLGHEENEEVGAVSTSK